MTKLLILFLVICTSLNPVILIPNELSAIISALNHGLFTKTNIIYTQPTDVYNAVVNEMPTVLFNPSNFGNLPNVLSSLLYAGFHLKELAGKVHYILFGTIFLTGFIFSTFYLASLKSILATGLYEPQINTFEELVKRNISFIIGDYDKTVLEAYDFPDILWNITRVVPYKFILDHRKVFDTKYAYLAHSDRLVLFKFQQQFMTKPRMRPLPIELMHSLPGFPMRREWLLRNKLSQTLLNCFGSGLMQKLAADTNRQTIHIGYLNLIESEAYEALALKLDYFAVPLLMLGIGLGFAFICFLGELLWH
ncbi:uncharacterized protein [Drosophila tropicalis]|uniref:uncharacterized protein n=1 Tax=Drosophila tropicalis TaxID=46794 RepID=UPI0035ABB117